MYLGDQNGKQWANGSLGSMNGHLNPALTITVLQDAPKTAKNPEVGMEGTLPAIWSSETICYPLCLDPPLRATLYNGRQSWGGDRRILTYTPCKSARAEGSCHVCAENDRVRAGDESRRARSRTPWLTENSWPHFASSTTTFYNFLVSGIWLNPQLSIFNFHIKGSGKRLWASRIFLKGPLKNNILMSYV